jgi:hypothetical protein
MSFADQLSIQNNQLLGDNNVFLAEIPQSLSGLSLVPDASLQDIFVLGLLYTNMPGVTPSVGALRYGRNGNEGEARIVAGVADLAIAYQAGQTYALSGGVGTAAQGPVFGVATGLDAMIHFYAARTLAPFIPGGNISNSIDLSQSGPTPRVQRIVAMIGGGTKLYAADATQPILAEYDLMSGAVNICQVDSQPTGLTFSAQGQIQVLTTKGTAQFTGDCSMATLTSSAPAPTAMPANTLNLPSRTFLVTERILEPTLPPNQPTAQAMRGTYVTLVGSNSVTVNIGAGTCAKTQFLAGTTFATPTMTTQLNLTTAATTLALYAQQTYPGEDCVATLSTGAGEALLAVRGSVEGLGATVFLLDRTWSMERSTSGVGDPINTDAERVTAMRASLISLLGSIDLPSLSLTGGPFGGPWSFMPFTNDAPSAWAIPQTGFGTVPALLNPDSPNGLRIEGFAGATSDEFDPGGPNDMTQAMRSALVQLQSASTLPPATTGAGRHLWILSDNQSGHNSYLDYQDVLSTMQKTPATLHYFGVGGFGLDPLLQQLVAQAWGFAGDHQYGPARGQAIETHTPSTLHEAVVAATVREVLRGRPLGTIGRGELSSSQTLSADFTLAYPTGSMTVDPWVLIVAAWDDTDYTPDLAVQANNNRVLTRCVQSPTAMVCAAPGQTGSWTATLSGSRPGGASTFGVVRAFMSSTGPNGVVQMYSNFAQSLYTSGQHVRVQAYLTERGLPLRLATVTAVVNGPNLSLGTIAAQANVDQNALMNLITMNGDLSPGQAKVDLLDPTTLPETKPIALNLTLTDDGSGSDTEPDDGIYNGSFIAFVPGLYTIDIHATYMGLFPNDTGSVDDRLSTNVVASLSQNLTTGSEQSQPLAGGISLRFTPQDSGKNLLGPGQAGALMLQQGNKLSSASFEDFLDGSYRVDVTDLNVNAPFNLLAPGSSIQIYPPTGTPTMSSGCSMTHKKDAGAAPLAALAPWLFVLLLLARRRYRLLLTHRSLGR